MRNVRLIVLLVVLAFATSCSTAKKVLYFQDLQNDSTTVVTNIKEIVLHPADQISILVSSKDPEMAALFNLTRAQYRAGAPTGYGPIQSNAGEVSFYTLDENGDVDFPQLGTIHLAGLTRTQAAKYIKQQLVATGLLKDPVVSIEFLNLFFSVLGEVAHPGKFSITKDCITILEAISMAGDMTITGVRNNIQVIRELDGVRTTYVLDIRSTKIFDSPAYYIQQNDVIYVQPNSMKVGQSTVNENNVKSVAMWVSFSSFLITLATLLINVIPHGR